MFNLADKGMLGHCVKLDFDLFHKLALILVTEIFFRDLYPHILRHSHFSINQEIKPASEFILFEYYLVPVIIYYLSGVKYVRYFG